MPESWRKPWATFRKIPDHSWQIPGWGGVSWYQLSLWKKICLFVRKCNVQTALGFFFAGWHFPFSCSVSNLHSSTKRGVEPRLQLGHTCHARRAPVTRPSLVRFPDPLGSDFQVSRGTWPGHTCHVRRAPLTRPPNTLFTFSPLTAVSRRLEWKDPVNKVPSFYLSLPQFVCRWGN